MHRCNESDDPEHPQDDAVEWFHRPAIQPPLPRRERQTRKAREHASRNSGKCQSADSYPERTRVSRQRHEGFTWWKFGKSRRPFSCCTEERFLLGGEHLRQRWRGGESFAVIICSLLQPIHSRPTRVWRALARVNGASLLLVCMRAAREIALENFSTSDWRLILIRP
jgi:hypothetical protein